MTTPDKATEERIQKAIGKALGIKNPDAAMPLRMGSTPGWDSMGHMNVVMELEKEFSVRFPPYRLPELLDVPSIARSLQASA
jgi:acyl carrier protein